MLARNLSAALDLLRPITGGKADLSGEVWISVVPGSATVSACDLDQESTVTIPGEEGDATIEAVVSGPALSAAVKAVAGESLALEILGGELRVLADSGAAVTIPVSASERRTMRTGTEIAYSPGPPHLCDGLATVAYCVGSDTSRPYLTGVHVEIGGGRCACTATDGHRLARVESDAPGCAALDAIVSRPAAALLRRLAGIEIGSVAWAGVVGGDSRLGIDPGSGRMIAARGGVGAIQVELLSRAIDGTYPDVARVIPKPGAEKATIQAPADLDRHAAAAHSLGCQMIAMRVNSDGDLAISGRSADRSRSYSGTVYGCSNGAPVEIACNAAYLHDALGSADELAISDEMSPIVLRGERGCGQVLAVVMPMRQ